jgi:hypothetical protein
MHLVLRLRAKPVVHAVLAVVGLLVVLVSVGPHGTELGEVLSGEENADGTAGWLLLAEFAAVFALVNAAVLGLALYRSHRARSRQASARRQDWMVARAEARLNAKAAAAHAAAANWRPATAVSAMHAAPEMVSHQPPSA